MSDQWCAACGHTNRPGAELCEMCDARLGDEPGAHSYTYGDEPRAESHADAVPPPRFKGVGDVFAPTLEVYRRNFLLVVGLVVVSTVPAVLLQYALLKAMAASVGDAAGSGVITPGNALAFGMSFAALVALLSLAGSALLAGSLAYAVLDLQRAGAASVGESLRRGLKVLPKVFLIDLMYTAVVMVGYLLLIVPGVIFSLMFSLVIPVAVAENLGPVESFKRSAELTSGYKGLIFLTYFLWGVAIAVLNLIISGSFSYGGRQNAFVVALAQALVSGVLNSTTAVLTVYIFLGLLNERSTGFDTRVFTPEGGAAAR